MATDNDHTAQDRADAVELTRVIRLTGIALVSALITATLVIGVGGAWMNRSAQASQAVSAPQTAG